MLTTHNMADVEELCDRVGFLVTGRMSAVDAPRDLKARYGRRSVRVEYAQDPGGLGVADFPLDGLGGDETFRKALEEEDADALGGSEDPTMAELLTATFRGRHRALAVGGAVLNLVLFAAAVFSAIRFLGADDVPAMLRWGAAMLLCFGLVTAVKIWYWLEMARLSLTRDVKRLELRVSHLHDALGKSPGR